MSTELINQVIELTNLERANAGLDPLTLNSQLADAAQDHSGDMATDDFFSHTGVDGSNVASRVTDSGYQYSTVGENIAAGQTTAEEVVTGWMNSPGHRANILNANFTEIGIGYAYLENDTGSVNYNYYWTQVFGTSLNSNQGSNPESTVTEDSAPDNIDNIANGEDINQQPDLEVVEETSAPAAEVELENSEQSESMEDINNDSLDLDNSPTEVESNLEVVEETSEPAAEVELENSEQSEAMEDTNYDIFNVDESIQFTTQYNDGDLISESHSVALAGGNDAISFGDSQGSEINLQFVENSESNLSEIMGNSYMGMTMDINNYFDSMDIIEYSADSSMGEVEPGMVQEVSESFL